MCIRDRRKEWAAKRAEAGYTTATNRIAAAVQKKTGMETRVCICLLYTSRERPLDEVMADLRNRRNRR